MKPACGRWTFCLLTVLAAMLLPAVAWASDDPIPDLQAIVDEAAPGATIVLKSGTYRGPVAIDKPLTIRAEQEGRAVLHNSALQSAVVIKADNTIISGMRIVDETVKETPAVLVAAHGVQLESLLIETGADGITIRDADDGVVTGTTIQWTAEGVRMAEKGNGIDLYNAHGWRLTGNTIRDVHDGIYLENSDEAFIAGNRIERSRYGVHCMYTKGTLIRHNEGNSNVTGAMVMASRQVTVDGNTFAKQSENVNSQGILLFDVHESVLSNNTVDGNRVGLYVEQSTGNRLEGNRISYNFIGIQLLESAGNDIAGNQFVGNVADAQARGSENNGISGNYWDGFRGIDADGDGHSDISYGINPFFQSLTQRRPVFQLFFQSPGMVFLESLYQSERGRWATDAAPLMAPPESFSKLDTPHQGAGTGLTGAALLGSACLLLYRMRRNRR